MKILTDKITKDGVYQFCFTDEHWHQEIDEYELKDLLTLSE